MSYYRITNTKGRKYKQLVESVWNPEKKRSEVKLIQHLGCIIEKDGKKEIVVTGLEFVRRDWTELSKKFQIELLNHIFYDKPVPQLSSLGVKIRLKGIYSKEVP